MAGKTAGTKSKSKTVRNTGKSAKTDNSRNKRQFWAIIGFVSGLLILALAIFPGESVWRFFHNVLYGLFSFGVFLLAPAIVYISVLASTERPISAVKNKIWQLGLLLIMLCGALHIFLKGQPDGNNFIDTVALIFEQGVDLKNGGLLGAVLGTPLLLGCGELGAKIVILLAIFTFVMILTGTTIAGVLRTASKPVRKLQENYQARIDHNRKEARFDIDVDLGPRSVKRVVDIPLSDQDAAPATPEEKKPDFEKTEPEGSKNKSELEMLVKKAQQTPDLPPVLQTDSNNQMRLSTDNLSDDNYVYPPVSLLKMPKSGAGVDTSEELKANAARLVDTLKSFGVQTRIIDISRGPTVTRYELQPSAGVKISRITGLADDIALNLAAAGVRIEAPIPNKAAVGIEVPNKQVDIVTMREIIDSPEFENSKSKLSVALGRDISGNVTIANLAKMPHMLIAGATGSGKSVCINSIIVSLLYKATPKEVKLLMVDPKVVELGVYNGIPHLLVPVVTDPRKAAGALSWAVTEMLNRYKIFADNNVRDLDGYNEMARISDELETLPQIVIIIDELADLMMAAPNEVEDAICRLAQMARAAGMHLVIATQRPSVDVITGVIKANIPSRIAFAVSSQVDSRTILDGGGAEKLLGRGDMLFYPVGMPKPVRIQGCFVSDKEVEQIVQFVKHKDTAAYDEQVISEIEKNAVKETKPGKAEHDGGGFDDEDEMLPAAIECVVESGQASTSFLQRKLRLGYARAARIIDELEAQGIIGPMDGSKPRQVLMTRQQWIERNMNQNND